MVCQIDKFHVSSSSALNLAVSYATNMQLPQNLDRRTPLFQRNTEYNYNDASDW